MMQRFMKAPIEVHYDEQDITDAAVGYTTTPKRKDLTGRQPLTPRNANTPSARSASKTQVASQYQAMNESTIGKQQQEELERKLGATQAAHDAAIKRCAELEMAIASAKEDGEAFKIDNERLVCLYDRLRTEGKEMYKSYLGKCEKIQALEDHIATSAADSKAHEEAIHVARAQLNELEQQRDAHDAKIQRVHDEHQQLQQKHTTLQHDYTALQQSVVVDTAARQRIAQLEAALDDARARQRAAVLEARASDVAQHLARRTIEQATSACLREQCLTTARAAAAGRDGGSMGDSDDAGRASVESWGSWDDDDGKETKDSTTRASNAAAADGVDQATAVNFDARVADALSAMEESISYTGAVVPRPVPHFLPVITVTDSPGARRGPRNPLTVASKTVGTATTPPPRTHNMACSPVGSPLAAHVESVGTATSPMPATPPARALPVVVIDEVPRTPPSPMVQHTALPLVIVSSAPSTPVAPVVVHEMLPVITIDEVTRTPSPPKVLASVGTSPLSEPAPAPVFDSSCSPMPCPTETASIATSPHPLPVLADFHALGDDTCPATLHSQIDSLTLSNELLRGDQASKAAEIAAKTSTIVTLQQTLRATRETQHALAAECEQLQHTVASWEQRALPAEQECDNLSSLLMLLQSRANHGAAAIHELRTENERLKAALASTAAVHEVEADLASARAEVAALHAEHVATEAAWQRKLDQQLAVNRNLQSDLSMIYERNKREVAQLEAQYKHEDYKQLYAAARGKIQRLEGAMDAVRRCKDKLTDTAKMQALTAHALHHAWTEFRTERDAHAADVDQHEQNMEEFLAKSAAFVAEKNGLVEELQHLRASVEHATAQHNAVQTEAETLNATVACLETKLQQLTLDYKACEARLANIPALETQVTELEDRCHKLTFENDMQQDQLASIPALETANAALERTVEELRAQLAASSALSTEEHAALEQRLADQAAVLATTAAQLEAKTLEYNELSDFMEEERVVRAEVIEEMERDAERSHGEIGDLTAALEEANASLATAHAAVAAATDEHAAREHELTTTYQSEVAALRAQVADAVADAVREAEARHEATVANLNKEVLAARLTAEQLGGELCEKELSLHDAVDSQRRAEEALQQSQGAATELMAFREQFKTYKSATEAKIETLRKNLQLAEDEVRFLDKQLVHGRS
eukprot:m.1545040 g.1545040  ORF g.1545040 m.1545040 type:complete len:1172 (+) comp25258_c0_seq24:148-3663(+)